MITIRCDKCERTLEVPDDKAGTKIACPACGDVNTVPRAGAAPVGAASPRTGPGAGGGGGDGSRGAPPGAAKAEETLMVVRAAMFRAKPLHFLAMMVLLLAGVAGVIYGLSKGGAAYWIIGAIGAGAGAVWWTIWKIATLDQTITVTSRRTIETVGLFSKATTEVMHDDIRNITVTQTFVQRLLNVGTIGVSSAAQGDVEIVAKDVPGPYAIRDSINRQRAVPVGLSND